MARLQLSTPSEYTPTLKNRCAAAAHCRACKKCARRRRRRFALLQIESHYPRALLGSEAGVANFLAVIRGENFDGAAHFVETRANALADAFRERTLSGNRAHPSYPWRRCSSLLECADIFGIEKISRQQSDAFLAVARIQAHVPQFRAPRARACSTRHRPAPENPS